MATHVCMTAADARAKALAAGRDPDWYITELRNHDQIIDEQLTAVLAGNGNVSAFPTEGEAAQFEEVAAEGIGTALRLVPQLPALARPLYDLELHLAALVDTEDVVPEELEQEYALELHATLVATVEKRDRVGQFIGHLKAQIAFAHAEATRLHEREQFYQRALDRVEQYVTRVIESLGLDQKGKRNRLEGTTLTLSLRGCDKRAEVIDEQAVPTKYKRVTLTLPSETWETVCDSLDLDLRDQVLGEVKSPKVEVSLALLKADLKADIAVPGAQLAGGTYLVVK